MIRILFLLCAVLLCLPSCKCSAVDRAPTDTGPEIARPVSPDDPTARLRALEARLAQATEERDEIARLSALRDLAAERLRQSEAETDRLRPLLRAANSALDDERTAQAQAKVWWFAGAMAVLALLAGGLAVFVPSVARWAVRLAAAALVVAALAVFVAWLLPWLRWIGGALALAGAIGGIIAWRLDAKSRDQVLQAVEAEKERLPGYKERFRQIIDSDADAAIDAARKRLGLKK